MENYESAVELAIFRHDSGYENQTEQCSKVLQEVERSISGALRNEQ
jgi:hypothetical protein